jgi:flagellar FliJ protein
MKFKFGLQKVLNHRKIQEDLAQREYLEVYNALKSQQETLEQILNSIVQARVQISNIEVESGPGLVERINHGHNFIRFQGLRAERQREKIKETEKLVEAKHEVLRQKAMDKKIIERLKDKKRKEFEAEQNKIQQKELDEIVSMRSNFVKEKEGS